MNTPLPRIKNALDHLENIRRCCDRGIVLSVQKEDGYDDLFEHIRNHLELAKKELE